VFLQVSETEPSDVLRVALIPFEVPPTESIMQCKIREGRGKEKMNRAGLSFC
jgi:hypothetical protein